MPLLVVWTLTLSSESEGPSLIACAAWLHRFNRSCGLLSAPSWRTEANQLETREDAVDEVNLCIGQLARRVAFVVRYDLNDGVCGATTAAFVFMRFSSEPRVCGFLRG